MTDAARTAEALVALPGRTPGARPLRIVEQPRRRRRPRIAYAMAALGGALAIGAAQMGLSIATTQGSYELSKLSQHQHALVLEQQALYDDVAGLSSPQYLAANAAALGMVIDQAPSYLRLSDGAVVGTGAAAGWTSSVDAAKTDVPNRLIADTPLVTAPDATIQGAPEESTPEAPAAGTLPPPITTGLPTPTTR